MDGFAVRYDDACEIGQTLRVVGEVTAGQNFEGTIARGEAVKISTGGYMPTGLDHVLIQEHARYDGQIVIVDHKQLKPRNIRRAGLDFSKGEKLVEAGNILGPAELAIAAASNHGSLTVFTKPVVAIIANGNELQAPGSAIPPGQIISSNPSALGALLTQAAETVRFTGIASDQSSSIKDHVSSALSADVIVPVGGASVGDYDLMRKTLAEMGTDFHFQGVAVRPGKPTWFGTIKGRPILGLPGNPLAAFVCGLIFCPAMLAWPELTQPVSARLISAMPATAAKEDYVLGVSSIENGVMTVQPTVETDSSRLRTLLSSNCLIRRPVESRPATIGDLVQIIPLRQN
jgi:molybdopterin molybdotransferase